MYKVKGTLPAQNTNMQKHQDSILFLAIDANQFTLRSTIPDSSRFIHKNTWTNQLRIA